MKSHPSSTYVQIMLVFDIDGVLTDPRSMAFNERALERIAADLHQGIPVALNTGRSTEWVLQRVLPCLQERCEPRDLAHLLLIAEKGGVRVVFDEEAPEVIQDMSVALPADFMRNAPRLLDKPAGGATRLGDYIFWDAGKRTMASFEKRPGVPVEEFDRVRPRLRKGIEGLLNEYNLQEFHIDETVIATDIQHDAAGKHKGAEQVLNWLAGRNERVKQFYSFGDSSSDEIMAEVFGEVAGSTFVYVGSKPLADQTSDKYKRVLLHGRFDADTAAFLDTLQ